MSTNGVSVKTRKAAGKAAVQRPWRSISVRTPIVEMAEEIGLNHVPKLMIAQVFEMAMVEMANRMGIKPKKAKAKR